VTARTQWQRAIVLSIGSIQIDTDTLDVAFEIERDEKPWPNLARIQVWNLNPAHRAELAASQGVECRLEAGYVEGTGLLFSGRLREATSIADGVDWITTLESGDGELDSEGEPIASKSIRKTWARGTPCLQILKDFIAEMKVDEGNASVTGAAASLTTGAAISHAFAVDGPILDELTYFMRSVGLTWSIQDGAFQVRLADAPASVGPLITPSTGLVGRVTASTRKVERENQTTKEKELTTWQMAAGTCLLLPELRPGIGFTVDASTVSGAHLCTKVRHVGDTGASSWYTEWEGRML
jgi:hypothetical protein